MAPTGTAQGPDTPEIEAPTIDELAVDALVRGDHGDPFALLGAHRDAAGHTIIRSFHPHASRVWVLDAEGDPVAELPRTHPDGLFSGTIGNAELPAIHRLRLEFGGQTNDMVDPYCFGEILGE
ncbi:MAG: 1,4-alpha-glucan branching enzyme, partial [Pseudomonadota bacterium]